MSTDITEVNSKNPFEAYGEGVTQRNIVGTLLKFSKGDYLAGQGNEEIPVGTHMVANMDSLLVGWIRWSNNKPTDQQMGAVIEGFQPPKRIDLGDNDKTQWDVDDQGQQRDPWQFSNYLVLANPESKELYTFTTSSRGGLNAIGELSKTYGKEMRQRPNEWPVIALNIDSYNHPNKQFGRIKIPVFAIVGWTTKTETQQLAIAANQEEVAEPEPAAPPLDFDASGNGKASKKTKF